MDELKNGGSDGVPEDVSEGPTKFLPMGGWEKTSKNRGVSGDISGGYGGYQRR